MLSRTAAVTATVLVAATGIAANPIPAFPYDPKTIKACNNWLDYQDDSVPYNFYVDFFGLTLETFRSWNPSVTQNPTDPLVVGQSYCVGICDGPCPPSPASTTSSSAVSSSVAPSATASAPAVATPSPIQDGMVKGCTAFTHVTNGITCGDIANQYGISVATLVSFNPALKSDCTGLNPGSWICVSTTPTSTTTSTSSATSTGLAVATNTPYYDDFSTRDLDGWSVYGGGFEYSTGVLIGSASFGGHAVLRSGYSDFLYDVDLSLNPNSGSGNAGITFRVSNAGAGPDAYNGYYAGISTDGYVVLGRASQNWNELGRFKMDVQTGKVYHLKVEAIGSHISVYVDDLSTAKIVANDDTYKSGMNGARVYAVGATFDNVRIAPLMFSDDFTASDDMKRWTVFDGSYKVDSASMVTTSSPGGKAMINGQEFTDFIFEADVTLPSGSTGNAGLVFRVSRPDVGADTYNGYYAGIASGNLVLGRADQNWNQLNSTAAYIGTGYANKIKVQARRGDLQVFAVDMNTARIAVNDNTYTNGMSGLRAYQTDSTFKNVKIFRI